MQQLISFSILDTNVGTVDLFLFYNQAAKYTGVFWNDLVRKVDYYYLLIKTKPL